MSDLNITIHQMNKNTAINILQWIYEKPYDFYNNSVTQENIDEMMDGSYKYLIDEKQEILGYFCTGKAAQVPAGHKTNVYKQDAIDIGLGMNPKFIGQGNGYKFCTFIINYFFESAPESTLRLSVAIFNKRAIHLYEKLGFKNTSEFSTGTTEFVTMVLRKCSMIIKLEKLAMTDATPLFEFESKNRSHFEKSVPSRGEKYYILEHFLEGLTDLLEEQNRQDSYFYLIKDEMGSILGRINIIDINRQQKVGHLGYRVGENAVGKGVASKAVAQILEQTKDLEIVSIKAKTTLDNIASQKVLEKNGFMRTDLLAETNDIDFVYYEWKIDT
ncbi:hypothetical protein BACCIP111883_02275 [Sutcliffiella rhizosphaerae]|uniref:N-acetyltransferase domain-containing protein n=2 Tax=Sutcliffiella rhizosphaerae TaxID=2880967 RepID=A0ABN8ADF4_9BACI|nr:hypothetical protein BACCIP111883_02275 [Sutcliffiella rhizosphaerae]